MISVSIWAFSGFLYKVVFLPCIKTQRLSFEDLQTNLLCGTVHTNNGIETQSVKQKTGKYIIKALKATTNAHRISLFTPRVQKQLATFPKCIPYLCNKDRPQQTLATLLWYRTGKIRDSHISSFSFRKT